MFLNYLTRRAVGMLWLSGVLLSAGSLRAEMMTLTDKQDRSIQADVMSLDEQVIKIKRADGIYFDLQLGDLNEADQKKVVEWAEKEAAQEAALPLPAHALEISVSRSKFNSDKTQRTVQMPKTAYLGKIEYETWTEVSVTEDWGYGITISNRLTKPIKGLKIEYRIFLRDGTTPEQKTTGTLNVGSLAVRERKALKSTGIPLSYSYFAGRTSPKSPSGKIYGIWLRVYRGDILEKEYATPENLITVGTW